MCPNPDKIGFATLRGAADFAVETLRTKDVPSRPYVCDCGRYHLTTKPLYGGKALTAELVMEMARAIGVKEEVA